MTRIRVDLRVPVGRALPDLAAFIVRCEQRASTVSVSMIILQAAATLT